MISDIIQTLEEIIIRVSNYTELSYAWDIAKNHNSKYEKRFCVTPLGIKEISGTTNAITYNQDFNIVLCDKYVHESSNDFKKQDKVIELMEMWKDIYKEFIQTRYGLSNKIISCKLARTEKPLFDEDSKTIFIYGTVSLLYRDIL